MPNFYELLSLALKKPEPFALGIITGVKGSSPQKKGAKALFYADGTIMGTLGGGCLEAEVQDRARQCLLTQKPAAFDLVLDHDFGWDDGLVCGGSVSGLILPGARAAVQIWDKLFEADKIMQWGIRDDFSIDWIQADSLAEQWRYQEVVRPPTRLWIAGSGHIAQAVAHLAKELEFEVTVVDDRPALANTKFFPTVRHFRVGDWDDLLKEQLLFDPDRPVFGLIVTRGHRHDALVLRHWIHQPFVYLGMIGSRRKARVIHDQFLASKIISEADWSRLCCPVGLEIGGQSVPEIAVSIAAQLIQRRSELLNEKISIPFDGRRLGPGCNPRPGPPEPRPKS